MQVKATTVEESLEAVCGIWCQQNIYELEQSYE